MSITREQGELTTRAYCRIVLWWLPGGSGNGSDARKCVSGCE